MMAAVRLPNGDILVPRRAEGDDGLVGDGTVTLSPTDDGYDAWDAFTATPAPPRD